jgi:putative DNA primase/helicase
VNRVVNLKNGSFRPGKPKDYIKKIAPTFWQGLKEQAPQWVSFLNSIFDGHVELITFIQKLFGYAITGKTSEHIFPIFWGQGRNGKSTLFETLASILGPLTGSMEAEIILRQAFNKNPGAPSPEIMALRGKRLVWFSESNEGRRIDAGKLKLLSGGDTLTGRDPYGRRQVNFRPTHKIFLLTNNRPKVDPSDYALWARLHLIPFTLAFVPEPDPNKPHERKSDKDLSEKLKAESSGILAWAVQGCLSWLREGLNSPEIVKAAIQEYREEEDIITHFIKETCIVEPHCQVKAGELYKAYQQWSSQMGLNPMNATRFGKEIKRRFDSYETNYVFYKGIGLLDT